jgi:hypothetical protein
MFTQGSLKQCFPSLDNSEASAAVSQEDLITVPAHSRRWHHPHDLDLASIQNAKAIGLWRFPPRFQRKPWGVVNRQFMAERPCRLQSERM